MNNTRAIWRTSQAMTILLVLSLLFPISTLSAGLAERVYVTTLENGLKVILLENHKAPVASFHVWYRVGSRNEEWGKTGLSHVLEHMMFKGTPRSGPERYSRVIQENGGNDNAFTSNDYTGYFASLRSDKLDVVIDMESDRMVNLLLKEEDFKTERMVVMEERRLRTDDNPRAYLFEQLEATAYQTHPYHWPIIGWMEDLGRLTLDDLKAYYRLYYNPANAFIVVAGSFDREKLLPAIRQKFGSIPAGKKPDQEKPGEQIQNGERRIIVNREAQVPYLLKAYHVPNIHDSDGYVLEVAEAILSGGKSSRFYTNLVTEKGLVSGAGADNSLLSRDPGLFFLFAEPLPGKDVRAVEEALDEEIRRLQTEPVGEEELEKAKNQLESSFVYSQDSIFYQAMLLARYEVLGDWRKIDDYVPSLRKVTAADIQRVTRKYLVPGNSTVGILVPIPPTEGKSALQARPKAVR
jgi:zinc protease